MRAPGKTLRVGVGGSRQWCSMRESGIGLGSALLMKSGVSSLKGATIRLGFRSSLASCSPGRRSPGKLVTAFVDNRGVVGALVRGSSKAPEVIFAVGHVWLDVLIRREGDRV